MKKIIKIRDIHLFEQEVLQAYLQSMAKQGWMITKAKRMYFVFEKCEPQSVTFFFDIYDHGNFLDPKDIDEKQIAYGDFIEQYEYELVCRTSNYQLFKRVGDSQLPIHTIMDETSLKEHRKAILRYEIYNFVLLALLFTVNLWLTGSVHVYTLLSNIALFSKPLILCMCLLAWYRCLPFLIWLFKKDSYHISVRMYELRENIQTFFFLSLLLLTICFLCMLSSLTYLFPICILLILFSLSFYLIDTLLKRRLKKMHTIVSMLIALYLSFIGSMNLSMLLSSPLEKKSINDAQESILLRYEEPEDAPYALYTIKAPFARDMIINTLLQSYHHDDANQTMFHGWEVYQDDTNYLLIKDNSIVELHTRAYPINQAELERILDAVE